MRVRGLKILRMVIVSLGVIRFILYSRRLVRTILFAFIEEGIATCGQAWELVL